MPMANVNGVKLNYVQLDEGEGAPREDLVMVHGLATNMAFWYFNYGVALSKRFRVTLYDLRGHGRSDMTDSGYRPADMARDLSGLLDHLKISRAHFMAHSFGGVVTLNLACEQPHRVSSLVLADSHFSAGRNGQARAEWSFGRGFQPILDRHQLDLDTNDRYFGPKLLTRVAEWQLEGRAIPAEVAQMVSPLLGKTGKRTSADWLKLMNSTSAASEMMTDDGLTLERLRTLRFPIVAMYGDNSPARLSGAELLDIWPHAEFRRVRDAGHFFPTLKPTETLQACHRFWDGEFAAQPRRHRAGEPRRSYFRSDRVFMVDGQWYFTTRDEQRVGPFAAAEEAAEQLASFLSAVQG
ncbi:alpha/beta fold hydrolase [Ideonella sp. BN130291]|uniref:alpha/beta fold hydrolase n=1 Tax=Ideonella sp. BN130291 TaxID=3112940 RepID=UPI002E26C135|nr:alpha/beta fold hydrolase [Ideonella sp. BN130291]